MCVWVRRREGEGGPNAYAVKNDDCTSQLENNIVFVDAETYLPTKLGRFPFR